MRQGKLGLNSVWFGRCLLQEKILLECFFFEQIEPFFGCIPPPAHGISTILLLEISGLRHLAIPSLPATPSFPVRKNQKAFFPQEIGV